MTEDIEISAGEVYRSVLADRTFKILSVEREDNQVNVEGLRPVSIEEVKEDIEEGRLELVDE